MEHIVKILDIKNLTPTVKKFVVEKPAKYSFSSGQFSMIGINHSTLKIKKPFTIASSENDENLEFIIKGYFDSDGVTKKLHDLNIGDELIVKGNMGKFSYKGPGTFIAAGTGIAPFISMLKNKGERGNSLIFSNKTEEEIILKEDLKEMFDACTFTLTQENIEGYERGRINEKMLKDKISNFDQKFYICGPFKFVRETVETLKKLGANEDDITVEGK